jgi:hypothetical protein
VLLKSFYSSEKAPVFPMQHRDAKTTKDRPLQKLENTAGAEAPPLQNLKKTTPASEGGRYNLLGIELDD